MGCGGWSEWRWVVGGVVGGGGGRGGLWGVERRMEREEGWRKKIRI